MPPGIAGPLTWAGSTVGVIIDPEICLWAETNLPKIAAYGFLENELPMGFEISNYTTLAESVGVCFVVLGVDRRNSAVGHAVNAGGYDAARGNTDGAVDESRMVQRCSICVSGTK